MNREKLKLWIEALRSGKYQQGQTALRIGNSYCCLGVLCDITQLGEWGKEPTEEGQIPYRIGDYGEAVSFPPFPVSGWLEGEYPNVAFQRQYVDQKLEEAGLELISFAFDSYNPALSDLNDKGVPFSFIADLLQDIVDGKLVSDGGRVFILKEESE